MDPSIQDHAKKLLKICRICGRNLDKNRLCKNVSHFKDILLQHFNVDVESDKQDIHPTKICECCRKIICKTIAFVKKNDGKTYRPQLTFFEYKEHTTGGDCNVCNQRMGRPVLREVVNRHNSKHQYEVTQQAKNNHIDNQLFNFEILKTYAEHLGFSSFSTENMYSFIIFHQISDPFPHLYNVISVNVMQDFTWNVYIGEKDVSKNEIFREISLNLVLNKDALYLLDACSKVTLCVGNEDFEELCIQKRVKDKAVFYDRSNGVIANEVDDIICKILGVQTTIRHKHCTLINPSSTKHRCDTCQQYRYTLTAIFNNLKKRASLKSQLESIPSSSFINNRFLSHEQLVSKLDNRKKSLNLLSKENVALKKQVESAIHHTGVIAYPELDIALQNSMGELKSNAVNDFPEGSAIQLLFQEQLKQSQCKTPKQMRWHPLMIRWCLGLYHSSPSAYDFVRKSCFLKLPHKSTLLDYSIYTSPQSGFNPDVIHRLYEEADIANLKDHQKNVSLLFDEMKIHSELVYNESTGKLIGFVELGSINEAFQQMENSLQSSSGTDIEEKAIATNVMTFMVRGIYTNLQFSFGFFPSNSLKADMLFPCVWEAVFILESIDLKVRCFVSDGASCNRTFYKIHSLPGEPFHFAKNLACPQRKIYFICDPPHLIKTVRNNWENSHGNKNSRNLHVWLILVYRRVLV